jgi:hypothetical protein
MIRSIGGCIREIIASYSADENPTFLFVRILRRRSLGSAGPDCNGNAEF